MQEMQVWSLGQEDPQEKEMATHSSILDWEIPWTEEPGRWESIGSQESDTTYRLNNSHSVKVLTVEFLHFKLTTLPFVIDKPLMEIYSETMQIFCFLLNFYPPILATIDANCFTMKWKR